MDWYNFCRKVCTDAVQKNFEPIGGIGEEVEINESKFGKRKYNKGRPVKGVWVFAGIDKKTKSAF